MRPLIRATRPKADPAPSRWSWRMQRLMLTPTFRIMLRAGLPFALIVLTVGVYLSDAERRQAISDAVADARTKIEERPEFMVKLMAIDGVEGDLAAAIRETAPIDFPISSFDLDLAELRARIGTLDGIKTATLRIRPGGILQVDVIPRMPAAVWRHAAGLTLIDHEGARVADIERRAEHPDLPLIVGEGADIAVSEALDLVQAASVLGDRFRGVVRMGDRRWDVVLDRDQRILLPEDRAVQAFERVIALERAQDILSRDVAQVDMRLAHRPTLRMSKEATQKWWQIKQMSGQ